MSLMNLMSRILPPSNVVLDLAATSKKRAFEQAGLLFYDPPTEGYSFNEFWIRTASSSASAGTPAAGVEEAAR